MNQRLTFLGLPGEIRELIYCNVLRSFDNKHDAGNGYQCYKFDLSLMRVNRQVYYEARKILREKNIFVAIETPWPEAQEHVRDDGYVPILITDEQARKFTNQHLSVVIDAPRYPSIAQELRKFIILLDDLLVFTEMWYYQDLSHPGLNTNLRLTLKLRDPYPLPFEDRQLPKALQQRLLEPFGRVKGLYEVRVEGAHYSSVEKAMRDQMAVPYKSAEDCLEEATRLKDAGNGALRNKQYKEAIKLYEQSFLAIHIVCDGRRRSVWGDEYFHRELLSGSCKGQHGSLVRLVLRVRLVANIVHAYLQLQDYEEARFWGQRSIDLMPGALDDEESTVLPNFAGAPEMGKIYYRTALAYKHLGNTSQARKLLSYAVKLLPNDKIVRAERDALALRLG
jgi:tetratricopeptide (TPR) repeat protein